MIGNITKLINSVSDIPLILALVPVASKAHQTKNWASEPPLSHEQIGRGQ